MSELLTLSQANITILSLFNLLGTVVALYLGFLKIRQYNKKAVDLEIVFNNIELTKGKVEELGLNIDCDILNSGLEPTSISKVKCRIDNEGIEDKEMTNRSTYREHQITRSFEKLRIEGNDRHSEDFEAYWSSYEYPEDVESIEGKVVFEGAKETIEKEFAVDLAESGDS